MNNRLCLWICLCGSALAQTAQDSGVVRESRWSLLAAPSRTPETGWQAAGLAMYRLADSAGDPSRIELAATYSLRGQLSFAINPDISIGKWRLYPSLSAARWPTHYYAPQSPASFRDRDGGYLENGFTFNSLVERRIGPYLVLGGGWHLRNSWLEWRDRPAQMPTDSNGGWVSGPKVKLELRCTDTPLNPSQGWSVAGEYLLANEDFGSSAAFLQSEYKARAYIPIWSRQTLAFGGSWKNVLGDVPFFMLPAPDGATSGRGLDKGVVNGRNVWEGQAEWRFPVWKRVRGAAFVDAVRASSQAVGLRGSWLVTGGAGLRYVLDTLQRSSVRLDLALVPGGGVSPILYIHEAF